MRTIKLLYGFVFTILLSLSIVGVKQCLAAEVLQSPAIMSQSEPDNIGYIYVGDSRLQGVDIYTGISKLPNVWVVAATSKGYGWLSSSAVAKVNSIENSNPQITRWVEVYALGINDMGNKTKYCEWYQKRALDHNVILLSMNPIEHHRSITDAKIKDFNCSLIATGLKYIDCYSYLMATGFKTADGVHYNVPTNKLISDYLLNCSVQMAY